MAGEPMPPGRWRLEYSNGSLAHHVPVCGPGTIFVLGLGGGVAQETGCGEEITFGRNGEEVAVCVGGTDRGVSRVHGTLSHHDGLWWLRTMGRHRVRLSSRQHTRDEDPVPLDEGYTPLFISGTGRREHLLEVYVAGEHGRPPVVRPDETTLGPSPWRLDDDEHRALVALAQRYLRHEESPQPVTKAFAAEELARVQPGAGWDGKDVERLVERVRDRLSRKGVPGLTRDEIGEPVGNALNHNLIMELLRTTTLVPFDLHLLETSHPAGLASAGH